jgi:hypothetical protein
MDIKYIRNGITKTANVSAREALERAGWVVVKEEKVSELKAKKKAK